jgi:bisphosphoglycerate-dependent phosphoglycerate mutase
VYVLAFEWRIGRSSRVDVKYGEDPLFLKWRREYDVKPPPI